MSLLELPDRDWNERLPSQHELSLMCADDAAVLNECALTLSALDTNDPLTLKATGESGENRRVRTKEVQRVLKYGFREMVYDRTTLHQAFFHVCLLYTSPSPRDGLLSRMPSSA